MSTNEQAGPSALTSDGFDILLQLLERTDDVNLDHTVVLNVIRITQYCFKDFEPRGCIPWAALGDRLTAMRLALRAISGLGNIVKRNPANVDLSESDISTLLHAMLGFDAVICTWVDSVQEETRAIATGAHAEVFKNALIFIRVLGGQFPGELPDVGQISSLKDMFTGTLRTASGLLDPKNFISFPAFFTFAKEVSIDMDTSPLSQDIQLSVQVINVDVAYNFLCLLFQLWIEYLTPVPAAQWFTSDLAFQLFQLAALLFERLMSSACPLDPAPRVRLLLTVLRQSQGLCQLTGLHQPFFNWHYILLRHRLSSNTNTGWEEIELYLKETFTSGSFVCPVDTDLVGIISVIGDEHGNSSTHELLYSFTLALVSQVGLSSLQAAKSLVYKLDFGAKSQPMHELMNKRLGLSLEAESLVAERPGHWRVVLKQDLQDLLYPEEINWMEDDGNISDKAYLQRVLDDATAKFARLASQPAEKRLEMIAKTQKILSNEQICGAGQVSSLPLYQAFVEAMFDGSTDVVTTEVRKQAFKCLARIIALDVFDGCENTSDVFQAVFSGLGDRQRSVRLAAGEALRAIIVSVSRASTGASVLLDTLFSRIRELADSFSFKVACKETLTLSIGLAGDTGNTSILCGVLGFLILEFKRQSPVLKAQAACQIVRLTKYHQKATPWPLYSPFMEFIAPQLVLVAKNQNQILEECCALLQVSPTQFFSRTAEYTIPVVVGKCDTQLLDHISKQLDISTANIVIDDAQRIIAHIFMLESVETAKSLQFIAHIVSRGKNIEPSMLVRGYLNGILGELVIHLGDEDGAVKTKAETAIKRVAKFSNKPIKPGRSQSTPEIGPFLRPYMLVIMTQLNDKLQEVRKKSSTTAMKQKVIRSLGVIITMIGSAVQAFSPQIMATLQTMVNVPTMSLVTLQTWHAFLATLGPAEGSSYYGTTSATLIYLWPDFTECMRESATKLLTHMIDIGGKESPNHLKDIVDFSHIPALEKLSRHLERRRGTRSSLQTLENILDRALSPNVVMAIQSLRELKMLLSTEQVFVNSLTAGDTFNPIVGHIVSVLFTNASRDGEGAETLRLLAFECIGMFGAVDPDRTRIPDDDKDHQFVHMTDFSDQEEVASFALHLITELLVGAFRSTSDTKYQAYLAYAIQELLKHCAFTAALLDDSPSSRPPSAKVRNRWSSLPKHVLETVTPLLEGKFTVTLSETAPKTQPIYPGPATYREWIQDWTTYLVSKVDNELATSIFSKLRPALNNNSDVVVAHRILPHLVLHLLLSGSDDVVDNIRVEFVTVLEDQVNPDTTSSSDKRLLSAQAIFMLLDHLNKWIRKTRQATKVKAKHANVQNKKREDDLQRIDFILSSINSDLMAKAAFRCKAYARSLMSFERQVLDMPPNHADLPAYLNSIHEIYAHLDEPDNMEGISRMILSPSLEQQIRRHESMGRWTSAQSCWETRLQQSPDNLEFHLGLLRCLRKLGHYDTLSTRVRGVLIRHPEWASALAGYQVESAWMVGAWDDVRRICDEHDRPDSELVIARVMLAIKADDQDSVQQALSTARLVLGAPITTAGGDYMRSYDSVVNLHLAQELESVYKFMVNVRSRPQAMSQSKKRRELSKFSNLLQARLEATFPAFRIRESFLSMRRAAFRVSAPSNYAQDEMANTWLASAKIARKAGQWQVAYNALLQAQQGDAPQSFIESSKLERATGDPLRALQDLENSMKRLGFLESVVDLTGDGDENVMLKAKAQLLSVRWNSEAQRIEPKRLTEMFKETTQTTAKWENSQFYYGQYQDECFKVLHDGEKRSQRGLKMIAVTINCYAEAIKLGSKFVYQTVPRLLALWDVAVSTKNRTSTQPRPNQQIEDAEVNKINDIIVNAFRTAPIYQWYTAFPQIVSRIGTAAEESFTLLYRLIIRVLEEYPAQACWIFISATKAPSAHIDSKGVVHPVKESSDGQQRRMRAMAIMNRITGKHGKPQAKMHLEECDRMVTQFLKLADFYIPSSSNIGQLSMDANFSGLKALAKPSCNVIIPLQEYLTIKLPPSSGKNDSLHAPFPQNIPTFQKFMDEVDIMSSLAKPRKITIRGSNAQKYSFLVKPQDDLRKDARLMDLNSLINKLLNSNSESRRRQLHVRTYGVVPLNTTCGFIQWVPNTSTLRSILPRWIHPNPSIAALIHSGSDSQALDEYRLLFNVTQPYLHHWFIETFPEPTAWLAARLNFARTTAVISMLGWIIGLGDRHCENILMDLNTGDTVHVDFNSLFEKAKTDLQFKERVPFRLTQNILAGLGITGVEGAFRISCEVTIDILRRNRDPLISQLDAFIHDPLVEFEEDRLKEERKVHQQQPKPKNGRSRSEGTPTKVTRDGMAARAVQTIENKLRGVYSREDMREVSVQGLVQLLIAEATSEANLSRMFVGWAAWV